MQFSLIEARIIVARMIQRFTFRLHKDAEVKEKFRTFMKLSNVYVTAHKIKKKVPSSITEPETTKVIFSVAEVDGIKAKIEKHSGKIDVYFGSNTGTCENLSHRLHDDSKRFGFDATLSPLDAVASKGGFDKDRLSLIVTSTYNGQPPNNAKKFARYCEQLKSNSLLGLKVAVIGIGNSNWKSFQAFPLYIENALHSAGAEILCRRGVADEENDMQGDIRRWVGSEFWPCAFESVGLDPKNSKKRAVEIDRDHHDSNGLHLITVTDSVESGRHLLRSSENELVTVISSRELQSPGSGRSTRHIEFQLPSIMDYDAGDHMAIFPENDPQLVLLFGSLIQEHDLGRVVTVTSGGNGGGSGFRHLPLGIPTKVSDLLGKHVDLQAPITCSFVTAAVASATDPVEQNNLKGILLELVSSHGDWQQVRPVQILKAFPSVNMTLESVLATLSPMKKRYYSISSSPLACSRIASVTVGLVEGTTRATRNAMMEANPENFRGVSSGYLADLRPGQLAEVSIVRNESFRLPKNPSTPVIMIGPGTGLAPFRGFLQELNSEAAEQREHRQAMLFFGCRNENDYLYRSELELSESSSSIELHVAFSRPTSNASKKLPQYVQDLLWENRNRVWQLLKVGAHIYVCGDGRYMAKDVDTTMCRIIVAESGTMNEQDAIQFLEDLQTTGGYLQDVWCN